MPAAKGNKYSPGRPVGARNERTEQWEIFSAFMLEAGLERFQRELELLEGEKFIQVVKDMMEFFKPKLARTEGVQGVIDLNQMDVDKAREITDSYLKSKKTD